MIDFAKSDLLGLKQVGNETYSDQITSTFVEGEHIISTYQTIRDGVVFTNKRIIAINVKGLTGKKKDYSNMPYSKIQAFSVETAGTFDLDSELELWFAGLGKVKFSFTAKSDVSLISKLISEKIL